jgi:hypothetical protein
MRSSSTDRAGAPAAGAAAWVRLGLVAVLGAAALVAPAAGVGRTGAIYTDSETAGFTVVPSAPPTTTSPTTAPLAAVPPVTTPPALPTPATPSGPTPSPSSSALPTATAVPTPAPALPTPAPALPTTGRGHPKAPGPAGH